MNGFKKICTLTILISNLALFGYDQQSQRDLEQKRKEQEHAQELQRAHRSATIWTGVAGFVGAAAGAVIGSWVTSLESDKKTHVDVCCVEYAAPCECDFISPRERYIAEQLDGLVKYSQDFYFHDDYGAAEQNIIINLHKLGYQLDQIDIDFFDKLAQDNKILSDAGYSIWWYGLKNLEYQKDVYLAKSNKIIAYFNKHQDFIRSCQIINFYEKLPSNFWNMPTIMIYPPRLPDWVKAQCYHSCKQYPLSDYARVVEAHKTELEQLQQSRRMQRSILVDRLHKTHFIIDSLLAIIYSSFEYQQEVEHQKQEELLAEYRRIEEEKLEIARKQNELLQQANRLAAEKNRIERERYQNYRNDRY